MTEQPEYERRYYPGLMPVESELWRAWLRQYGAGWSGFRYNLHLSAEPRPPAPDLASPDYIAQASALQNWEARAKRLDVLAYYGPDAWLFEIKERGTGSVFGQLALYESLLPASLPDVGTVQLGLIAARVDPDALALLRGQGIRVWVLE